MAITITQSPQAVTPSDNPVTWVFDSTQTAQPNFYYLIEVYVATSVTFSLIERHKVFPEFGSIAHFDASSITERYANVNDLTIRQLMPRIKIKIIEKYNNTTGSDTTSSEIKFWKARLSRSKFVNYNFSEYYLTGTNTIKFLTLQPRGTAKVKENDLFYLSWLKDSNGVTTSIKIYDSSNTLIDSTNVIDNYTEDLNVFFCGINTLINDYSLDFTNATYYTVELSNLSGASSEVFRINIDQDCQYSTRSRFQWINSLGGIDSYTFGLFTREKTNVESYGYERQFGSFDALGGYNYDLNRGTVIDYLKSFSKELEVTSDWMIQSVQNWISKSLYTSPVVFLEQDQEVYRCKVTNTSFDKKIQETDMVFQEVATIELESDNSINV